MTRHFSHRLAQATLIIWLALPAASQAQSVAFTDVTVVDGTGAAPKPHLTVIIADARIVTIGPSHTTAVPADARVVRGAGKVLIPGLWDMHVHLTALGATPLSAFIAAGVTGVRDMGGNLRVIQRWQKRIGAGTLVGPRIVAPGPILDGPQARGTRGRRAIATAEEGVATVRELKEGGAAFIKTHSLLPREAYFAIAAEAQRQGLEVCGHVPNAVRLDEAIAAGQTTIEHLVGVALACSTREAALRARLLAEDQVLDRRPSGLGAYVDARLRIDHDALQSYSPAKATAVFARLAQHRVWQCPTLVTLRAVERRDQPQHGRNGSAFSRELALVRAMRRAGVPFLAGTDLGLGGIPAGSSLHDELALLVRAGLTPMEALQAATRNAARALHLEHQLGTVEEGKLADLVLLDADPLRDIRNTTKIRAVVVNGHLLDRAALDQMLVAGTANKWAR
jgi:imidazolonepropionase-like amidohydrolase